MKFSAKLGGSLIALIAIGLLAVSYLFYHMTAEALKREITQRAEDSAAHIMDNLERFMFERLQDSIIVATSVPFKEEPLDLKKITQRLADYRNNWRSYSSISFYDLNGRRVADTSGLFIGMVEKDRLFFREAIEKGTSAGTEVALSFSDEIPVMYFSSIVKGKRGEVIGVVAERVPLYKLQDVVAGTMFAKGSRETPFELDLIGSEGKMLYSTRKGVKMLEDGFADEVVLEKLKTGAKSGVTPLELHGKQGRHFNVFIVERGYLDYKGNGRAVVLWVPEEYTLAPLVELRRKVIFVFLVVLFLAGFASAILSRQISRPIGRISAAALEIGKGSLDVNIDIKSRDEIGLLARAFNEMAKDLKDSRQKLKNYAGSLEVQINQIKERTGQLEQAKASLEIQVAERTKALRERRDELEKAQTAMLYMVEDLNRQADELRSAQETLVRSEKLAAVGQLASSVAHELRNPLGVIKNAVYYFNMLEIGKNNSEIQENLDIISKEITHSDRIIGDLLDFSRIKEPSLQAENINVIVKETLVRLGQYPGMETIVELDEAIPLIRVDALQIQHVFLNLATNAVQSMEKLGKLAIKTQTSGKFVDISFIDTGCGIPKENLNKIFEPLFSTRTKGTGLGLAICASIIGRHNGKIEVESEPGKGSTFKVKLPMV